MANCNGVVVIPCPKAAVASLHFPHLKEIGFPTSSISKSILFKSPSFCKKDENFSKPTSCAILTDPIFPDRIKICSTVRSVGILLSYSLIGLFAHSRVLGKFLNSVLGSISASFIPAAIVKVLKTEPNS